MTISAETTSANLELADVERDQWARFKGRLRTNVGEDFYTSWFARAGFASRPSRALTAPRKINSVASACASCISYYVTSPTALLISAV